MLILERSRHLQSFRTGLGKLLIVSLLAIVCKPASAQSGKDSLEQERAIADRFLTVLLKRPRPGTALDRVYGFHVRNATLDELVSSLDVDDSAADAGARAMILGLVQLQRGQPARAAESLNKAESRLPDDAVCSHQLGRALLAIGQTEQAAAAMERAIERGPARNEALPIFTELGRIYGRAGLNDKALNVWTRLEEMFPDDSRVGGQIARTLAEEGNDEEAFRRYTELAKSARQEESRITFAVRAAEMKRRLGKAEEATEDLEAILNKLRPGSWLYADVRNRIEDGFLKSGDFDALANYYTKRLEKDADNLELRTRLGRILVSAGRLDEARLTLQKAVERAPDDTEVRLALIDLLLNKSETSLAAEQFEHLAKQDPENPDYLLRWGQTLLEDQDKELGERRKAATEVWQRLADARVDDAVTLAQVADRMRSIDQQDDAIRIYRKAIEIDPASPQYREYLGEYLHQLDRPDEAIEVWESIAGDDRRNRDSLVRLAEVFATFDLPNRSVTSWEAAAEFDLTFAQELRFARVLRESKKFETALERLEVAEGKAESPDERDQLLKDRITTYSEAGTLADQIAELKQQPETAEQLRELAMMYQAAGQLTPAAEAIAAATKAAPDSIPVLVVAADIAERQNRFLDAVELFRTLSNVDTRYQTNYLQRIARLQSRMGQVDESLSTCEDLIEANPASTESYQFYARTALQAGRQDSAIEALRRAMNVARRDNGPRNMLASIFADAYRTDEAIDLYWQALEYESKPTDRIGVIRRLAPLYDRRDGLEPLIQRIENLGRKENDVRTTQLMMSAAHEAVEDYGAARQALDRLLARQPRDVALLESMVRLSDAADELVLAADFQQRIVNLADTPENRSKLVQLKLDAGLIDIATALSERVSLASDPARLGGMIRSAAMRNDTETAIAICREAIRGDSGLWDVKLMLAQLLLNEKGDDAEKKSTEAVNLTDEIIQAGIDPDAKSPTRAVPASTGSKQHQQRTQHSVNPQNWAQYSYQFARTYRLGRYGSANYGSSYGRPMNLVQPASFQHARVLAMSLKVVHVAKGKSGDELEAAVKAAMNEIVPLPPLEEIKDAARIWEHLALEALARQIIPSQGNSAPDKKKQEKSEQLAWRLAELDSDNGPGRLYGILHQRLLRASAGEADASEEKKAELTPLSDHQLQTLMTIYEAARNKLLSSKQSARTAQLLSYQAILKNEFALANQPDRAEEYEEAVLPDDAPFADILGTITFYLQTNQIAQADALVDRLLPSIRNDEDTSRRQAPRSSINGSIGGIIQMSGEPVKDFIKRNQLKLLDALIANSANAVSRSRTGRSTLSDGTVRSYYRYSQSGGYRSMQLKGPLSTELFGQSAVSELSALFPAKAESGNRNSAKLIIPLDVIFHLAEPFPDAPPHESKTRRSLSAFAHWWADRPADCFQGLVALCDDYPDDVDLQIERARLASELGQTRVALEALDSFDPLDSQMLVRKEMAAMNLASELGDVDRARQAAERLFGMRMDTNTQIALADQLRRLGMKDRASAVLRRLRGGKARDENTEMQIANAFIASDDKEAAAEVAYSLLKRLNSGRGRQVNNSEYYRRQAVSILQSAGRLDSLIERAERRMKSAPESMRTRTELAELYNAAGRTDDAAKLWEGVAGSQSGDARLMLSRADALSKAKKHKDAMLMYLAAFEKEPQLFENSFYKMLQEARQADASEEMYEKLLKIPSNAVPYYRVDELLRIGDQDRFGEQKRKFVLHVLKADQNQQMFYRIVQAIPKSARKQLPELRDIMIKAVCSETAFQPQSNLWQVMSYSSGGKANGALEEIVDLIRNDGDAWEKFDESAAKALEVEANAPTARFLSALLELSEDGLRDAAIETLREVTEAPEKAESSEQPKQVAAINGNLLWQAGQILEETDGIDDRPSLLVAVYEMAARSPNLSRMNDIRYSVVVRLIKAYGDAGQPEKARRYLIDAYNSIDNSQQNQYNPGYGDYQDLSSWKSIADQLVELDYPIDALAIYHRAIASPDKFEKSERWGRRQSVEEFETAAKAARKKATPAAAIAHLNHIGAELLDDTKPLAIQVQDLPLSVLAVEDVPTGLALSITKAAETEDGQQALVEFSAELLKAEESRPADWSLPATRLMISGALGAADLADVAKTLLSRLPTSAVIAEAKGTPHAVQHRTLLDLYTPVSFVIRTGDEQAANACEELVAWLRTAANTVGDAEAQLALTRLTGDPDTSLVSFIEAIESNVKPGATLSSAQFKTAMQVAASAAESGDIELSTRAVTLALGNGPPLRQISKTGDAFTINRNRNRSVRDQPDSEMTEVTQQLLELINVWTEVTGHQLGTVVPKKDRRHPDIDPEEALNQITTALSAAVMPKSRGNAVFSYAKPVVSLRNYDRFGSDEDIGPHSASIALARAAAASGRSQEMVQAAQSRLAELGDTGPTLALLVDLTAATGDEDAILAALKEFADEFGSELPEESMVSKPLEQLRSINSQQQRASYRKSEIVNQMMQTVWPLAIGSGVPDAVAAEASELLGRTVTLINSDSYTANRHRQVVQKIQQQALGTAADRNNSSLFSKMITAITGATEQQVSGYSEEQQYRVRMNQMQTLLTQISKDGHMEQSHGLLRQMIELARKQGWDFESVVPAVVTMDIARESKEQQLELLQKIALGESDDAPILHGAGLIQYQVPPEILRYQTPRWEEAVHVSACDPDFPVCDTLLMLADVAAELSQSEQLAERFTARSNRPGDDAAIAAAIIRVTGLRSDPAAALNAVRPTLDVVAVQLSEGRPAKTNSKLAFPDLACYLVVRSIRAELQHDGLEQMLDDCRAYAFRGKDRMLTPAISRFQMRNGVSGDGRASFTSPLKHFVAVAVPNARRPDTPTLAPQFAVDQDGWLHTTGGYRDSMLMLKYPVTGSFQFSAEVVDAVGYEVALSYGGVLYEPRGHRVKGLVASFGSGSSALFPVPSIKPGEINEETLQITPEKVVGLCNGESWITDITATTFPWAGIAHDMYRTTKSRNLRISGDVTIPEEVNLIHPTMRGWAILNRGSGLPDPLLPIDPKKDADEINSKRQEQADKLAEDYLESMWSVKEELRFKSSSDSNRRESPSYLEYLRPLLDGESIEVTFWWAEEETGLDISLGRMQLGIGDEGAQPGWIRLSDDLASAGANVQRESEEPPERMAPDNVPVNDSWNTVRVTRDGDNLQVLLNDKPLTTVAMERNTRFGIVRPFERDVRIQSITLTGDWPTELPENLMETVSTPGAGD